MFSMRFFTIIEMLVVFSILAILITLLNPSFQKMTESANRLECLSRQKGVIATVHVMSDDNNGYLPNSGTSHARSMRPSNYQKFMNYNVDPSAMICPNINFEGKGNKAIKRSSQTMHIGYQYFGNNPWLTSRRRTNNPRRNYILPSRVIDDPGSTLIADDNGYANTGLHSGGGSWVMAPHHVFEDQMAVPSGTTPISVGADGGNVGLLDGSSSWKDIHDMKEYYNSTSSTHFGYW